MIIFYIGLLVLIAAALASPSKAAFTLLCSGIVLILVGALK